METEQYLDMFLDESREHLQIINDNILQLEKEPEDISIVNEIFRSAHTLKGMSATMGFEDIASLTHKMENVLDLIRNHQLTVNSEIIDSIIVGIEYLEEMVQSISEGNDGKKDVTTLLSRLEQIEKGEVAATTETIIIPDQQVNTVDVEKLDLDEFQLTILKQAKEQGFEPYQISVELSDECILKGARAYMVFEALESHGEIIQTTPTVEEIEDGNFGQSFQLTLLTGDSSNTIKEIIEKVSEVKEADIQLLSKTLGSVESEKESIKKDNEAVDIQPAVVKKEENSKNKSEKRTSSSRTIRVNLEKIDDLLNLFEEVVIDRSRLEVISETIDDIDLKETVEHMSRVSSDMQSLILAMRMVPIEQVFNRFPRMIRGLSKDLNKQISLEIIGADTELDRTVIDEIGDPLVHLIRNSVDHGIEIPEERRKHGKPEEGKLVLRAFHSGNHVFIEIEDDGAGINRDKVQSKAIENGLITEQEAELLTDDQIAAFIMSSGFSTADKVSDISGRGVGLDVVKSKIESLGGQVSIETNAGQGSIFSIQLPLTLSIIATLLVSVQKETYAVPLSSIIETVVLPKNKIMLAHGKEVMDFRGKVIPIVSLASIFNVPAMEKKPDQQNYAIVVVKKGEKLTGLIVDAFIGQKEVVLKSLGNYLGEVFAISGATILGDGEVALIIDPNALVK
ncbi:MULTISPECIES: chemotaxis protein CheA [Oceanobacillus]|uniref:Chemotaxis protein CheA n=1 Tax=Oceanobacillus kimchii TaxID=746691 RepID=A0ABQ5TL51_9BACI|nr:MULTISPECIES: chemotaxis protein CheA [Oceanobacillus]MBT2600163.1 chemotaxis protein CheA [Oceanobacillus sp. ISL-74]MBT2650321.1 chemotaxis protein CheA [Oceanobacillus sp. ISL-73]MCT1578065.1 chemotaxis protein CheA [Oceanobacillus kimchii]MCT2137625.1 chemotaxis protein CheA [Oceanobacillus kimchii]GLO67205.1 chemotaxis protein CheA [Oceanobacillus kimchii]